MRLRNSVDGHLSQKLGG